MLSRAAVQQVLDELSVAQWLIVSLLYGSGLRVGDAVSLRVKDLDLERCELTVRGGKGARDRRSMLPGALLPPLRQQIAAVNRLLHRDQAAGYAGVELPDAMARKSRGP